MQLSRFQITGAHPCSLLPHHNFGNSCGPRSIVSARSCRCTAEADLSHSRVDRRVAGQYSRRSALAVLSLAFTVRDISQALATETGTSSTEYVTYTSDTQGYALSRPASWEQVGKAGADALFRDPQQKSTTVGVTVYPVMIASLEEFGSLEEVGKKLLDAERAKESTLGVEMMAQQQRPNDGSGGGVMYDFRYRLDSTRGVKEIFSTVAVVGRKLYILNGNLKCQKPGKGEGAAVCDAEAAGVLQRVAASFRV